MENKITEEELKLIKEDQQKINNLLNQLGYLEAQKHGILHELADINKTVEETKKELEEKYGHISINLEDGSYEEIKEKEQDLDNV